MLLTSETHAPPPLLLQEDCDWLQRAPLMLPFTAHGLVSFATLPAIKLEASGGRGWDVNLSQAAQLQETRSAQPPRGSALDCESGAAARSESPAPQQQEPEPEFSRPR
jgi:hypothetical protein